MKKTFFLALLLVLTSIGYAQAQRTITGRVTDANTGEGISSASIVVQGTTVGTKADNAGNYSLTLPANATVLVFSSVGYNNLVETIGNRSVINARMTQDVLEVEEFVVVGYGSGRRVSTITASTSTVSNKTLVNRPVANVLDAMQGQVAGLQVYTSTGEPSATQSVRLHGVGSFNASNTPLYVVDGVPIPYNAVISLNPSDFQSVTVLKDASATSIYGSRASNGVIYYTTKRGTTGSEAVVTVKGQYGVSNPVGTKLWDNAMNSEQLLSFWGEIGMYSSTALQNLRTQWTNPTTGVLTNTRWFDYVFNDNAPTYQTDISIQGGGKASSYYISASQFHQDGIAAASFYDRYTVRANMDAQVKEWMKVGMNISLSSDNRSTASTFGSSYLQGGVSFMLRPFYSPYVDTPLATAVPPAPAMPIFQDHITDYWYGVGYNPHYMAKLRPDEYNRKGLNGSTFIQLNPIENLTIVSRGGADWGLTRNDWNYSPIYRGALGNGTVGKSTDQDLAATITNTIEYKYNVDDNHDLTFLAGQEGIYNDQEYYYAQSSGVADERLMRLQDGKQANFAMSSSGTSSRFNSYFGRVNYGFQNRIFVDASIRTDASSRFSKNNRSATFWAVGAMWNIRNEDFMKSLTDINDLRFKVSYGTQGNSSLPGDYLSRALVGTVPVNGSTPTYNGNPSWVVTNPGNDNLKWESQKKLTIAIDGTFWKIFTAGIEVYQRTTEDMLFDVPLPLTTGFGSRYKNVGALQNRGIDITLGVDIFRTQDYYLRFSTVFNYNKQKITKLFDEALTMPDGTRYWTIANTYVAYVVGSSVTYYSSLWAGVNPETGLQEWYLPDPDGNINKVTKDRSRVTTRYDSDALLQNTGKNRYAPIAGGFSLSGGWKGIDLTMDFSYALGKYLISNDQYFAENPIAQFGYNSQKAVMNYWKNPGDNVRFPDWTNSAGNTTMQFDSHLISNASFMRLKNIQLSYTLPTNILKKVGVLTGVRVYLQGRNLLTFTNYNGVDPEVDSNLTYGRLTNTKQYTAGIEIKF